QIKIKKRRRIYIINKKEYKYIIGIQKEESVLTSCEFQNLYIEEIKGTAHVVQKAMISRALSGDPFDCRIHLEKNGKGNWRVLDISVRIGIGQTVISNVGYGGGRARVEPFLEMTYGEKWAEVQ